MSFGGGERLDNINDILSSLSDDDIENLKAAAASIFENGASNEKKAETNYSAPDFENIFGNAQMMAKIASLMNAMNKTDNRTRLIEALKPLLSEKRRKKADEAMQLMKLLELMPMVTRFMEGEGK